MYVLRGVLLVQGLGPARQCTGLASFKLPAMADKRKLQGGDDKNEREGRSN